MQGLTSLRTRMRSWRESMSAASVFSMTTTKGRMEASEGKLSLPAPSSMPCAARDDVARPPGAHNAQHELQAPKLHTFIWHNTLSVKVVHTFTGGLQFYDTSMTTPMCAAFNIWWNCIARKRVCCTHPQNLLIGWCLLRCHHRPRVHFPLNRCQAQARSQLLVVARWTQRLDAPGPWGPRGHGLHWRSLRAAASQG